MSDNLPVHVQEEIIKWCPVKSLIRFRSVSKAWKSLIDSPQFIAAHRGQSHRLLIEYYNRESKYVSIMDDHTFPQQSFAPTVPLCLKLLMASRVVGSSDGLFCLSGYHLRDLRYSIKKMAILWNPSITKSIAIGLPNVSDAREVVIGFGVCPVTRDPKILLASKLTHCNLKVFTMSSQAWRSPKINLPREFDSLHFLSQDEFGEVELPNILPLNSSMKLSMLKTRGSLALIEGHFKLCYDVWLMEDGVSKSFIKAFTIRPDLFINRVLGFRRTDEAILEVRKLSDKLSAFAGFAVYDTFSQHIMCPVITGFYFTFSVFTYTETLLLLDQQDVSGSGSLDMDEDGDDSC